MQIRFSLLLKYTDSHFLNKLTLEVHFVLFLIFEQLLSGFPFQTEPMHTLSKQIMLAIDISVAVVLVWIWSKRDFQIEYTSVFTLDKSIELMPTFLMQEYVKQSCW